MKADVSLIPLAKYFCNSIKNRTGFLLVSILLGLNITNIAILNESNTFFVTIL